MASKKQLLFALVVILLLSGCKMPYSTAPEATPTEIYIDESLFPTPMVATEDPMAMVSGLATASAIAMQQTAGIEIGGEAMEATVTPLPDELTITMVTPEQIEGVPTSTLPVFQAVTPFPTVERLAVSTPEPGSTPSTYTLQVGEFPYCIARRFNVNPDELLALNNLADGSLYMPGLVLKIPQSGNPFPASRALRPHPATYTVSSSGETFYSIACLYGDVDPAAIASANGMALGSTLQIGTSIQIP